MADVGLSGLGLLNASSWGFAIMSLAAFFTLAILSDDDEPEGGAVSRPTQTRFPKEGRSSGGVCGAVEQRARRVTARIEASIDQGKKRARKNLQLARKNIDANIAQGKKRARENLTQLRERAEKVQQQTVKNLAELRERVEKVEGIGPVRNPLRARQFISEDGLGHLSRYAYKSGDYSFMDNLLNHFWVWSVEFLPLWMAPNMVTLLGSMCVISSYLITLYHCNQLIGALPSWVNVYIALALFAYQTLDAIDGKQARRTKQSSPLGQLFDHGCDAMGTTFICLNMASACQFGPTWQSLALLYLVQVPFFLAQWEEYHTHTMRTSVGGVFGVTEAQLFTISIHLFTAYVGGDFWLTPLAASSTVGGTILAGAKMIGWENLKYNDVLLMGFAWSPLYVAACNLGTVLSKSGGANRKVAVLQLVPLATMVTFAVLWATESSGEGETLYQQYPQLLLFPFGILFTHLTNQMIVNAMCRTKYRTFQKIILPLPVIYLFCRSGITFTGHDELYVVAIYAAAVVFTYFRYILNVIEEICEHLQIHVEDDS